MRALVTMACVVAACGGGTVIPPPDGPPSPTLPRVLVGEWRGQGVAYVGVNTQFSYPVRLNVAAEGDLTITDLCPIGGGGRAGPWYGETRGLYWNGSTTCSPISLLECEAVEFVFTRGTIRPATDGALLVTLEGTARGCAVTSALRAEVIAWPGSTGTPSE